VTATAPPRRGAWRLVPVAALLAYAAVLRAPVTVVPPLVPQLAAGLHLTAVAAGLLTSIPVLCFGLLTPAASRLLRALGINHAGVYCLLAVVVGSLLRSSGGVAGLFAGTLVVGAGLTIGNIAAPMLIGRQFQHRAPLLTGAYSATMNAAVTASTALAVPVAALVGWRWSAASWGVVLGGLALVGWLWVYPPGVRGARASVRRRAGLDEPAVPADPGGAAPTRSSLRRWRVAWLLSGAFAGHTLAYFALTAWLPSALADLCRMTAAQAGAASALFQAAGVVGPFVVPALVQGLGWSTLRTMTVVCAAWTLLPGGLLLAPAGWPVWSLLGGAAPGAFFTVLLMVIIQRTRDVDENRRLSAMVQGIGYCGAAIGPVLLGWLHETVTGWSAPFGAVLLAVVTMSGLAIAAVRDRSSAPLVG
jgi:CP family cyanate transporter-like MFS transporter